MGIYEWAKEGNLPNGMITDYLSSELCSHGMSSFTQIPAPVRCMTEDNGRQLGRGERRRLSSTNHIFSIQCILKEAKIRDIAILGDF